ncbi:hypothetical protein [Streptomyces sp. NBC_00162]|uniref:hypothetical protein n=1 Tax=Streptomyces sp. NBC_00162 TaxID=2903629 RepID=UPI00214AEF60|nr:hypothetical protein [Streptomyces sp. NBC_00162]UUU44943.1 hypothetical protein JIW86_15235 [Streptomyces sp. NBC_00162]
MWACRSPASGFRCAAAYEWDERGRPDGEPDGLTPGEPADRLRESVRRRSPGWAAAGAVLTAQGAPSLAYDHARRSR